MSDEPLLGAVGTYQNEPITTIKTFATRAGSFCHWESANAKRSTENCLLSCAVNGTLPYFSVRSEREKRRLSPLTE